MSKLTAAQSQFLQKFITGKNPVKRKLVTKHFMSFERRAGKVEEAIQTLPENDPQRAQFQKTLDSARAKARDASPDDPKFREAHNDLKQVKRDLRAAAARYRGTVSPQSLAKQIAELNRQVRAVQVDFDALCQRADQALATVATQPKASDCNSLTDALQFLRGFTATEANLRGWVDALHSDCDDVIRALETLDIPGRTKDLAHQIRVLSKNPQVDGKALASQVLTPRGLSADAIRTRIHGTTRRIEEAIAACKSLSDFQERKPVDLVKEHGKAQAAAGVSEEDAAFSMDQVKIAVYQEEILIQKARIRAGQAARADRKAFQQAEPTRTRMPRPVAKFDAHDLIAEALDDVTPPERPDAATIEQFRTDAADKVHDLLTPTVSDRDVQRAEQELQQKLQSGSQAEAKTAHLELQRLKRERGRERQLQADLAMKTPADFEREILQGMGLDGDTCTPEQKEMARRAAAGMAESVIANFPNKTSGKAVKFPVSVAGEQFECEAPEEFCCHGAKYKSPKLLGAGAFGAAFRYEDANQPGKFVVLKVGHIPEPQESEEDDFNDPPPTREQLEQQSRQAMVRELEIHRHVMGPECEGHENVVKLEGVVLNAEGKPHMVMEYAEGGDLATFSGAMHAAGAAGALSDAARTALTQHLFVQAVQGLQHIQGRNATHHDIKEANCLITADGTLKMADFGSGQIADNPRGEVPGDLNARGLAVTPKLEAPEINTSTTVTGKADTYTLGTMLSQLSSPTEGKEALNPGSVSGAHPRNFRTEPVTALDRLKAAMLDPDPTKRPPLEAVATAAYVEDGRNPDNAARVPRLLKAVAAYGKAAYLDRADGKRVTAAQVQQEIATNRARILMSTKDQVAARQKYANDPERLKQEGLRYEQRINAARAEITRLEGELKQIHASMRQDPQRKKALEDLEAANAEFK